jgi:hypothetical protein
MMGVVTCCATLVQHTPIEQGISVLELIDEISMFGVRHKCLVEEAGYVKAPE